MDHIDFFKQLMRDQFGTWPEHIDDEVMKVLHDPDPDVVLNMVSQLLTFCRTNRTSFPDFVDGKLFYRANEGASVVHGTSVIEARSGYKIWKAAFIGGHVAMLQRDIENRQPDLIIWDEATYEYPHGIVCHGDETNLLKDIDGLPCWVINTKGGESRDMHARALVCNGSIGPAFRIINEVLSTPQGPLYVGREIDNLNDSLVWGHKRAQSAYEFGQPLLWKDGFLISRKGEEGARWELMSLKHGDWTRTIAHASRSIEYCIVLSVLAIAMRNNGAMRDKIIWGAFEGEFLEIRSFSVPWQRDDMFVVIGTGTDGIEGLWVNTQLIPIDNAHSIRNTEIIDKVILRVNFRNDRQSVDIDLTKLGLGPEA
jgi:hypothetical protein